MKSNVRASFAIGVLVLAIFGLCQSLGFAQGKSETPGKPDYFKPITDGDGLRYPLEIGPLVWRVLGSGIYPVKGSDGLTHLAYELLFTNVWRFPATINSVEVVDPAQDNKVTGNNRVLSIKSEDVTGQVKLCSTPSTLDRANYTTQIPGGQSGVMFFDVTYPDPSQVPHAVAHRVSVSIPQVERMPKSVVVSRPVRVSSMEAIVLTPPMKGDGWVDSNGCCLEIGPHRFVTNPMNGTLDPSEGFAIDWIKVDAQGHAYTGDGKKPEQWLDYGVELLAVAPGTVVEVVRDLPDEPPGKTPDDLTIAQFAGNRVILDLGSGRYVMYAHLVPSSIPVHVGDYVRQGEKIGLLGNSGNTDAPHLHFQVMDRPSSLDATSLPFVFDTMQLQGRINMNLDVLDNTVVHKGSDLPIDHTGNKALTRSMPLSLDIVSFK
jgi:Peptidase family M23